MTLREAMATALGGMIGASARWASSAPFDVERGAFPWPTLVVNLLGCFLIGVASRRLVRDSAAWSFVVPGVLGGFTTMSLLALELNDLAEANRGGAVVAYLVLTLAGGTLAVLAGERGNRPDPAEGEP